MTPGRSGERPRPTPAAARRAPARWAGAVAALLSPPALAGALAGAALAPAPCATPGPAALPPSRAAEERAPAWADLLAEHLARYPAARADDVYKFTHQSVFGPAHAVPRRQEARRWLLEEVAGLGPGPEGERVLDRLSDDPPLARLNLRPFLAAGGDLETVVDAFVATAAGVAGSPAAMAARLDAAVATLRALGRAGDAGELAALAERLASAGYPAIHQSAAYRSAYAPAYRVVRPDLLCPPGAVAAGRRDAARPAP